MKECSDSKLLEHVAEGGPIANDAFSQLVSRYGNLVLNSCHRLVDHCDAEDAAQAVFIVLWRKADGLFEHENIAGWLHRVSRNVCRNANRPNATRNEHEMNAGATKQTHVPQWNDIREVLDRELDHLPTKYRSLLINVYLQGNSIEEAAKSLGLNASTCRTRLSRARELLRSRLARRGIGISAAPLVAAMAANANAHIASTEFLSSTSGLPTQTIPPTIESLAQGTIKTMAVKTISAITLKIAVAIATIGSIFAVGVVAKEKIQIAARVPQVVPVADGSILVVPFTTELQRLASPSYEGADYLIEVNGRELFGDNPNPSRKEVEEFEYDQIAEELEAIDDFKDAKVAIRVVWPSRANLVNGMVCQAHLWLEVKELCKEAVRSDQQVHSREKLDKQTWRSEVAMLSKKATREGIRAERAVRDGQVGVYQPQTPFSKFLYQDADCVVHLVPPLLEAELSAIESMDRAVSKLGLKKKARVTFLFTPGRQPVEERVLSEEFFGSRVWKDRLGFSDWCQLKRL